MTSPANDIADRDTIRRCLLSGLPTVVAPGGVARVMVQPPTETQQRPQPLPLQPMPLGPRRLGAPIIVTADPDDLPPIEEDGETVPVVTWPGGIGALMTGAVIDWAALKPFTVFVVAPRDPSAAGHLLVAAMDITKAGAQRVEVVVQK